MTRIIYWPKRRCNRDLDGDGDLDAFVANGLRADKVWLNDGNGNFSDSGQSLISWSKGLSLGDVDGDGDLNSTKIVPIISASSYDY